MGIMNLQLQNKALLLKHLHKFYNKADIPWVSLIWNSYYNGNVPHATVMCGSFWWKDILTLADLYKPVVSIKVKVGDSLLFWSNGWILNNSHRPLRDRFPHLFSFVKDDKLSVQDFITTVEVISLFYLPLSQQAAAELEVLSHWLHNLHLSNTDK